MSIDAAVARISQIQTMLAPPSQAQATPAPTAAATSSSTTATDGTFATALSGATQTSVPATLPGATTATTRSVVAPAGSTTATVPGIAPVAAPVAGAGGAAMVQVAASQVGVAEQPPGSNDGPQVATYRASVAGAGIGPWCAQFASWVARGAGEPLGEQGQGFQSVAAVYGWAQRTGRALPAGSVPSPGDLIVWGGEHIGIVESVGADGSIHTIEGNSGDAVTRHTYGPDGGGATGFVKM
jgi:hypothetical protein